MQRFGAVHTYAEDVADAHVTPRHADELAASQCLSWAAIVMSVVLVSLVVLVGKCVGVSAIRCQHAQLQGTSKLPP